MMTACVLIAAVGLLAQVEPEPALSEPVESELFRVHAIHATNAGNAVVHFDSGLSSMRDYLAALPYDTYRVAGKIEQTIAYGTEAEFTLGGPYMLYCLPQKMSDDGEVLFEAHIDLEVDGTTLEALRVSGQAARGSGVVFRGLELDSGELIVVLSVARVLRNGDSGGTGQAGGQQTEGAGGDLGETGGSDHGDGEGDGEGKEDESEDEIEPDEAEEREDSQPSRTPRTKRTETGDKEASLPPELANVEAILRALEAQDEREQESARNRRFEVIIRGDWW